MPPVHQGPKKSILTTMTEGGGCWPSARVPWADEDLAHDQTELGLQTYICLSQSKPNENNGAYF